MMIRLSLVVGFVHPQKTTPNTESYKCHVGYAVELEKMVANTVELPFLRNKFHAIFKHNLRVGTRL